MSIEPVSGFQDQPLCNMRECIIGSDIDDVIDSYSADSLARFGLLRRSVMIGALFVSCSELSPQNVIDSTPKRKK